MTPNMIELDQSDAALALHALRFYMNAKGDEVSDNTEQLVAKLDAYVNPPRVQQCDICHKWFIGDDHRHIHTSCGTVHDRSEACPPKAVVDVIA